MKELTFTQEDGFYVAEVETNGEPIAVQVNRKYFPYPHDYSLEVLGRIDPSMPFAPVQMFDYKSPRNIIVYQNIPIDGCQLKLRSRTEVESAGYLGAEPTAQIVIPTEEQVGFENPFVDGGYIELMAIYANAVSPDLVKMYIDDSETDIMDGELIEITTDFAEEIPFLANYVGQFCYFTVTYTELGGTHSLRLKIGDSVSRDIPILLIPYAPTPTITVTHTVPHVATIEIDAEGADDVEYSFNNSDWIPYSGPIEDTMYGNRVIYALSHKEGCTDSYNSEGYYISPEPLCFTSQQDGSTIAMYVPQQLTKPDLRYSRDGKNWEKWTFNGTDTEALTLDEGEKLYVYGFTASHTSNIYHNKFVMTGKIAASGDCYSLILSKNNNHPSLMDNQFAELFSGCTALTTAPRLSGTALRKNCYSYMFGGCTALTSAPELPATSLAEECYKGMFNNCTSLTSAPELPATSLAEGCYKEMFNNCTSLNSVTVGATSWDSGKSYGWLNGVASTGSFTKPVGTDIPTGKDGIPNGWTVVNV